VKPFSVILQTKNITKYK